MGAFGELLQRHFGGTIHDVSTWTKSDPIGISKDESDDILYLNDIKDAYSNKVYYQGKDKANKWLQGISRTDFTTHKIWCEFVQWSS